MQKKFPNILITGTPGTGKSQHCERLKELLQFKFFNIGDVVKDNAFHTGRDEEFDTLIVDEDKLLDYLEGPIAEGGCVIDHHCCQIYPERFFHLVVVLRCENSLLYPRLEARGYKENKITENISAEIMQVVADEAADSYEEDIVVTLKSETPEDLEFNCQKIVEWVNQYMNDDEC